MRRPPPPAALLVALLAACAQRPAAPPRARGPAPDCRPDPTVPLALAVDVRAGSPDVADVVVTARATAALPSLVLGLDLAQGVALVAGATETRKAPVAAGEAVTLRARLRRAAPGADGLRVVAHASTTDAAGTLGDERAAWLFGPEPQGPAARPAASLGANGIGPLGPGERVVRTPDGQRLHETEVP